MEENDVVRSLAALAQPVRLQVFRALVVRGATGLTPGTMAEALNIPPNTLSFHLKELARSGLVSSRQESRFIYYSTDYEQMAGLMTFLTQNCCQGMPQECLSVMETALGGCCAPSPKRKSARSKS